MNIQVFSFSFSFCHPLDFSIHIEGLILFKEDLREVAPARNHKGSVRVPGNQYYINVDIARYMRLSPPFEISLYYARNINVTSKHACIRIRVFQWVSLFDGDININMNIP